MNTKKIIKFTTIALGSIAAISTFTFADNMRGEMQTNSQMHQKFGTGDRPQFGSGQKQNMKGIKNQGDHLLNSLTSLISTGLSDSDKQSLNSIIENYKTNTKAVIETYSGTEVTTGQREEIFNSMKQMKLDLLNSVQSYISSEKFSEYTKLVENINYSTFVAQKPVDQNNQKQINNNKQSKNNAINTFHSEKQTDVSEFKYIKGNTYTLVKNKLDTLSNDNLDILLDKLDTIISKTTNETSLGVYNELRTMISDKLGNTYDESANIIDSLLN